MKLFCATGNQGKLREFRLAAQLLGMAIEPLPHLHLITSPDETGATFEENACIKALAYGAMEDGLVFADDSGLEVDALNGEPGVYSARYAGPGATDLDNNALLLSRLAREENRAARFVCFIALVRGGSVKATFRGVVEGLILREPRGPHGFGYDPLFYYPPFGCSFGEVEDERKFAVSHRGNALRAMLHYLHDRPH
jgi:XTP/dITP diphosphohydrolase